jgi:hypothetical protein
MEAALAQAVMVVCISLKTKKLASPKEGVKTYAQKYYKKNSNAFIGH